MLVATLLRPQRRKPPGELGQAELAHQHLLRHLERNAHPCTTAERQPQCALEPDATVAPAAVETVEDDPSGHEDIGIDEPEKAPVPLTSWARKRDLPVQRPARRALESGTQLLDARPSTQEHVAR